MTKHLSTLFLASALALSSCSVVRLPIEPEAADRDIAILAWNYQRAIAQRADIEIIKTEVINIQHRLRNSGEYRLTASPEKLKCLDEITSSVFGRDKKATNKPLIGLDEGTSRKDAQIVDKKSSSSKKSGEQDAGKKSPQRRRSEERSDTSVRGAEKILRPKPRYRLNPDTEKLEELQPNGNYAEL